MVYKRMPEYSAQERLARLPALDPSHIRVRPEQAFEAALLLGAPERIRVTTLRSRPVYRFQSGDGWVTVFADDATTLESLTPQEALEVARDLFPEQRASARYVDTLIRADQWTFNTPFRLTGPLHKISLGDREATDVYVGSDTGDVVMKTTRASRLWGYAGPVLHWIYFTPLRSRGPVWANLIIYGSVVGCVLCVLGLIIGVSRYSPGRRYKQGASVTPYSGWLRWHHYGGLLFGAITFTWLFSGMLSMEPWDWTLDNVPTPEQIEAIRGDGLDVTRFAVGPAEAVAEFQKRFAPSEIDLQVFMDQPYYIAYDGSRPVPSDSPLPHMLVRADGPGAQAREDFGEHELLAAARVSMPGLEPSETTWMTGYDAYYYGTRRARRLPALRVKFDDPSRTWLYLDAHNGALVQRETSRSRTMRWLYHGFHSLDFPGLYQNYLAWTLVVILLSAGGILLSATSIVVGWRHLRIRLVVTMPWRRRQQTVPVR